MNRARTLPRPRWFAVWRRNARVWTKLLGPAVLGNLGEPVLYLFALGYGLGRLVGEVDGMSYLQFLASGIVCSSVMFTASFEGLYSAFTRMAVQRTWDAMLTAPLGVADIVTGEALWAGSKALLSALTILAVAAAAGAVAGWEALLVLPVALLLGTCFAAAALVVTALSPSYDFFMYYQTLLLTPMLLLSGVFFPLEALPPWVALAAQALPLHHGVALVRPLMTGTPVTGAELHLLVLVCWTACAGVLAVALMRRRLLG